MRRLFPDWGVHPPLVIERAQGYHLYDAEGNTFLDFSSGITLGHGHPPVVAAVREQAERLLTGPVGITYTPAHLRLVGALQDVVPSSLDTFFFCGSKSEAVAAATQLARQVTGRPNIVRLQHAGNDNGPSGVLPIPYPKLAGEHGDGSAFLAEAFANLLASTSAPADTAAIIIRPFAPADGYAAIPGPTLEAVRALCNQHNILLIQDESESGAGRSGRFFAGDHYNFQPDILLLGPSLSAGLPFGGLAAPSAMARHWQPAGRTAGPLAAAAAAATIDAVVASDLAATAAERGAQLQTALRDMQARYPYFGDVRGLGLMIGLEIGVPVRGPDAYLADRIRATCLDRGLLLKVCGPHYNVLAWAPPLVITGEAIDDALAILEDALEEVFED